MNPLKRHFIILFISLFIINLSSCEIIEQDILKELEKNQSYSIVHHYPKPAEYHPSSSHEVQKKRFNSNKNILRLIELDSILSIKTKNSYSIESKHFNYSKKFLRTFNSSPTWEIYALENYTDSSHCLSLDYLDIKISRTPIITKETTGKGTNIYLFSAMQIHVPKKLKPTRSLAYAKDLSKHDFAFIPLFSKKLYRGHCLITLNIQGFIKLNDYSKYIANLKEYEVFQIFYHKEYLYAELRDKNSKLKVFLRHKINAQGSKKENPKHILIKTKAPLKAIVPASKAINSIQYLITSPLAFMMILPHLYSKYKKCCEQYD